MTYYLRPRQDISVSTLAGIMNVWTSEHRDFGLLNIMGEKSGKPELRIYFFGSHLPSVKGAIESACKWAGRRPEDFKIMESDWDPTDYLFYRPKAPRDDYDPELEEEE